MPSQETAHGPSDSGSHGAPALGSLGILEMLAEDPRPTFIIDIKSRQIKSQRSPIVHRNAALLERFALNDKISGIVTGHSDLEYTHFRDWTEDPRRFENYTSNYRGIYFGGILWTAFTVRGQFRIIGGDLHETRCVPADSQSLQDGLSDIKAEGRERQISNQNQNARADMDSDSSSFSIATSVASVRLFDDEMKHREQMASQLDLRTKELLKSAAKFQRLADRSPVGIITADPTGSITYANQAFYDITGHSGTDGSRESWLALFPDDAALELMDQWLQLHQNREPIAVEHPLKKPWTRRIGSGEILSGPTWILLSAFAEENEDGTITGSVATVSDISQQKWAEEYQKRRAEDAMELKRRQEAFVDMTSHEIRNPLSAMIQSADSISSSLASSQSNKGKMSGVLPVSRELIKDCIDAADTITLCALHQKRVIDDILTLSKLDSDMLVVTPVDCEPLIVIRQVLKMFDSELKKHEILVSLDVEASFHDLNLIKVKLDPSRLTQVLVNILGNAIKFTQTATERRVTVKVGASVAEPLDVNNGIEYLRGQKSTNEETCPTNTRTQSNLCYLCIAVHDTGPGLKPIERQLLFKRFGQASPRTHVDYGGSGLGLFISKKLSELQGGAIGLASQPGHGSDFAFYVQVQRLIKRTRPSNAGKAEQAHSFGKGIPPEHHSVEMLSNPKPATPVLASEGPVFLNSDVLQRKLAILVVEDNLVNQRVLCKQLRNLGHIVYAANHGKEALKFLEQSSYWVANGDTGKPLDIILLDTEMPVMDGLTCARSIRQLESQCRIKGHVPIISVTANARSAQIETATAAGMDDTISKPFRVADLTPKMDLLVRRYGS